ncbi:MAG TPA: VOC family protein [Terriglobales bacterium]|nr:VOC family protein [Terriglobales bacterium]
MAKLSRFERLDQAVEEMLSRTDQQPRRADSEIAPLLPLASELRELPREEFVAKLGSDLERSASMATVPKTIPERRTHAVPALRFKNGAKAIEFYQRAFGATEIMRFENELGLGHAELAIGDSVFTLGEEWPEGGRFSAETLGNTPITIELSVPDVNAFVEHAVAAGAKLIRPLRDEFYGRRQGTLQDPFGYVWGVSTETEKVSLEEMHRRFRSMMSAEPKKPKVNPVPPGYRTVTPYPVAQNAVGLIDFVKNAFDAEEKFRSVGSTGGIHAEIRIGDSMLMMGGGGPELSWHGQPIPMAFHIYVRDCDATYRRALDAGGTSIAEPVDQPYGERSGSVKDPAGNFWYIATFMGADYRSEGTPDVQPYLHPLRARPLIDFLKRAFDAEELGLYASPDGVVHHATINIGNSHLEMGEAHGVYQPMPGMFHLYVPDCDAVYRRALAAGATSIAEPKDQDYGDRMAGVKDVFGNKWYIATHIRDAGE